MNRIENRSGRLKQETGASLLAALFFFMLCGVGASMLLAAASAFAGTVRLQAGFEQKRLAVEAAAAFLRDELMRTENTVKILEIIGEDSEEDEPFEEVHFYYAGMEPEQESSWQEFAFGEQEAFLDSYIRACYVPMLETEEESGFIEEEKSLIFSVQTETELASEKSIPLTVQVRLSMDEAYQITAIISDMQTDEAHEEDRCERKLVVPARVTVEEMENETDDGTTITRLTTICWERGVIERVHSLEEKYP